jgi:nucleoside 2-deoxyribosyltransferase
MKVYVAGPDVFRPDARENAELVRNLLRDEGIIALIPIDNEVSFLNKSLNVVAMEIYSKNVAMIDQADAVLANIEPFRGDHMDPGTAFEIGYAVARGIPVYCFTPHAGTSIVDRVEWCEKKAGVFRDNSNMLVEDFGHTENLMIAVPAQGIYPTLKKALAALVKDLIVTQEPGEEHA